MTSQIAKSFRTAPPPPSSSSWSSPEHQKKLYNRFSLFLSLSLTHSSSQNVWRWTMIQCILVIQAFCLHYLLLRAKQHTSLNKKGHELIRAGFLSWAKLMVGLGPEFLMTLSSEASQSRSTLLVKPNSSCPFASITIWSSFMVSF